MVSPAKQKPRCEALLTRRPECCLSKGYSQACVAFNKICYIANIAWDSWEWWHFANFSTESWPLSSIPSTWRNSILVPIFKEKGDVQECKNYRGIKLLTHTFKLWEKVVDRRLRECTEIHESQFGFMPGRSTTDATSILATRQAVIVTGIRKLWLPN